jgi:hypothetical protein
MGDSDYLGPARLPDAATSPPFAGRSSNATIPVWLVHG